LHVDNIAASSVAVPRTTTDGHG